jgi:hypothetical protein
MFFAPELRFLPILVLVLTGCAEPLVDSGESTEVHEETGPDTSSSIPETLSSLGADPIWESQDQGVATGLGFADFDGDGDADLVVAYGNDIRAGPVVIYENQDGVLDELPSWEGARNRFHGHLSTGDLDGDGWVDLAVSVFLGDGGWDDPGGVDIYLNRQGVLSAEPDWSASGFYSFSSTLGDVDLDGDLDLAVAVGEAYSHAPDRSRLYINDGSGNLGTEPVWTTESDRHSFDAAFMDINRDGYLDLAFANHGSAHTLYLGGSDGLSESPDWEADGSHFEGNTLDWGDVDGDGFLDLVISDNEQMKGDGRIRIYCGPELAQCWESEDVSAMQSAVSLEDLDGDGRLELVAGAWLGEGSPSDGWGHFVRVYDQGEEGLGTQPAWWSTPGDIVVEAFAWADLDGSDFVEQVVEGEGLVALPQRGRVLEVQGGVAGDGYISGPGTVWARYLEPRSRDLAVSDWNLENGNLLFAQQSP